jgi:hypothetical protein
MIGHLAKIADEHGLGEHMDAIDILIRFAIFACFVVFAICMWLIRKQRDKRRNAGKSANG